MEFQSGLVRFCLEFHRNLGSKFSGFRSVSSRGPPLDVMIGMRPSYGEEVARHKFSIAYKTIS